jgi:hypothetical protein
LGRRFLTRGSARPGRRGFTFNRGSASPGRASFSQRSASTKLIRSGLTLSSSPKFWQRRQAKSVPEFVA